MPMSTTTLRTCAGGHVVKNADVVGMTMHGTGVQVWCVQHTDAFDLALGEIAKETQLLQM